mgnify:CR=1 FL=1
MTDPSVVNTHCDRQSITSSGGSDHPGQGAALLWERICRMYGGRFPQRVFVRDGMDSDGLEDIFPPRGRQRFSKPYLHS